MSIIYKNEYRIMDNVVLRQENNEILLKAISKNMYRNLISKIRKSGF